MCGFVSRITTGELGSVEKTAWICQTFLPHGLGPSNHPEKPRPGHRTVLFWGKLPASGKQTAMSSIHYLYDSRIAPGRLGRVSFESEFLFYITILQCGAPKR